MATTLQITGWTGGTIDLRSATYKASTSWIPQVAARKRSRLSGPMYTEVNEAIPVLIETSTPTLALAAAGNIAAALDQAERWNRGDQSLAPVILEYKPEGSGATGTYKAVITGSSNPNFMMQLAGNIHDLHINGKAQVNIQLTRRGLWSGDTDTAASGSAVAPVVVSGTFTNSEPLATPVKIDTTIGGTLNYNQNSYWLATNAAAKLELFAASTLGTAGFWGTTAAAVGTSSRTGTVLEFLTFGATPIVTWQRSGAYTVATLPSTTRSVAIFGNVRNIGANPGQLRAVVKDGVNFLTGTAVAIPYDVNEYVTWYYFGTFSVSEDVTAVYLEGFIQNGLDHVDIRLDDMMLLAVDGDDWAVAKSNPGATNSGASTHVILDHRYLEELTPAFTARAHPVSYNGSPFVNLTGNVCAVAFLSSIETFWRHTTSTLSFSATRARSYLVPI